MTATFDVYSISSSCFLSTSTSTISSSDMVMCLWQSQYGSFTECRNHLFGLLKRYFNFFFALISSCCCCCCYFSTGISVVKCANYLRLPVENETTVSNIAGVYETRVSLHLQSRKQYIEYSFLRTWQSSFLLPRSLPQALFTHFHTFSSESPFSFSNRYHTFRSLTLHSGVGFFQI